jgi:hypothetical protein
MANAAADDVGLLAQALDRSVQLTAQVPQVGTADVGQFDVLEVLPDSLVERIEVRGIAREL